MSNEVSSDVLMGRCCKTLQPLKANSYPLVSIIIPTRNRSNLVIKAVHSALHQSYRNIEVIVIDDHSTDDTQEQLRELCSRQNNLKVYYSPKKGACAARNYGIEKASGYFITGLDDDDLFTRNRVERLVQEYEERYSLVAAAYKKYKNYPLPPILKIKTKNRIINPKEILTKNYIGNQALTTKEKLVSVGGFDESMKARQDYDLWVRLVREYGAAKLINEQLYYINVDDQLNRISNSRNRKRGTIQFYRKYTAIMNPRQRKLALIVALTSNGIIPKFSSCFYLFSWRKRRIIFSWIKHHLWIILRKLSHGG